MFPETRTLLLSMAVSSSFLVLVLTTLWYQQRDEVDGLGEWSLAFLLMSIWAAVTVAYPQLPQWRIAATISSLLLVLSHLLIYEGLRRFLQRPKVYWPSILLFSFSLVGILLAAVRDVIPLRFFSVFATILCSYLMILLVMRSSREHAVATSVFMVLAFVMFSGFAYRIGTMLAGDLQIGLYAPTDVQRLVNLVYTLFAPLAGLSLVLMVNDRVQSRLHELATCDSLTGVLNRRAFLAAAEAELERSRRYGTELGLVMIDLDHFKRVNDTFGHQVGDQVLVDFTQRVTALLRAPDLFGRIGGEEFVLLLPQTGLDESLQVAERIRYSLAVADTHPPYTASFGVATAVGGALTIESLIANADSALYRAKAGGRNRVEFTPPA
jgi:diguanylate cyclase (GGDEF)-like protein